MSLNSVLKQLRQFRVIPVVRTSTPELAATAIEWLSEAGLRTLNFLDYGLLRQNVMTISRPRRREKKLRRKGN